MGETKKIKELNILGFSFLCFFLMLRIQQKFDGSKNLYVAQNLASGDRVTGKATVQPERMDCWFKVYLHHLSQDNIESLLLTPSRINFKTRKNSELIHLLMPTWATAEFFLDLDQR